MPQHHMVKALVYVVMACFVFVLVALLWRTQPTEPPPSPTYLGQLPTL